jgi:DNA-binding transcriptional MerR regulator
MARELDISPAILHRWSEEFKGYLSSEANAEPGRGHRRYNDSDLHTLREVKVMLDDGLTYEQIRKALNGTSTFTVEPDDIMQTDTENVTEPPADEDNGDDAALVAASGSESPALAFLTNTLSTLSDSQKSILNSQAANRELLGVLLQDNFNLKEENNRLRERILEVEREVAQTRQEDEWRRETLRQELEAKITAVGHLASQAMNTASSIEVPEIKTVEDKNPGCLGVLFGGGGEKQIVTTSRRRKAEAQKPGAPPSTKTSPAANHPKPLFPPE